MTIPINLLRSLQVGEAFESWRAVLSYAWEVCSQPIEAARLKAEISNRDRALANLDYGLATTAWTLWHAFESVTPQTSDKLGDWWLSGSPGRAVLILDALSLREVPWVLQGATERGYTVHSAEVTTAELPADTTSFAKAIGYGQRSALESGKGSSQRFVGAKTESVGIPWRDCISFVGPDPDVVFWHHWPDSRLHDLDDPGEGVEQLSEEAAETLSSDDFWTFIERLTQGRRLVVTGDHGYAASGLFPDIGDTDQAAYLKKRFKSGRCAAGGESAGEWAPPISMTLKTRHGTNELVLGRRKWKSPGGYPTLTHGGMSLLEVAVPFLEISR